MKVEKDGVDQQTHAPMSTSVYRTISIPRVQCGFERGEDCVEKQPVWYNDQSTRVDNHHKQTNKREERLGNIEFVVKEQTRTVAKCLFKQELESRRGSVGGTKKNGYNLKTAFCASIDIRNTAFIVSTGAATGSKCRDRISQLLKTPPLTILNLWLRPTDHHQSG